MGGNCPGDPAHQLHRNVQCRIAPLHIAARRGDQTYRRIHLRPGNRSQHGDKHEQDSPGRGGIADQRHRVIPVAKRLGHDPRADNGDEQEK